ncbi:hypothetical protein ACSP97_05655 [Streptomyces sp. SCPE 10]
MVRSSEMGGTPQGTSPLEVSPPAVPPPVTTDAGTVVAAPGAAQ